MFYFYILRCKDGRLYCGSTHNTQSREKRHNAGYGAKYTKIHGGGEMVYTENYQTLLEAMRREAQVKRWSRQKKEDLIRGFKS